LEENEEWGNTNWLQENKKYKFPELFKNWKNVWEK